MDLLGKLSSLFGSNRGYTGLPSVVDVGSAKSMNPYVLGKYQAGEITADELYQILTKGNVGDWGRNKSMGQMAPVPSGTPMNFGIGWGEEAPGRTWHPEGYEPQPLDPTDRGWEGSPSQDLSKKTFGYSASAQAPQAPQTLGAQSIGDLQPMRDYVTGKYPGSRITPGYFDTLAGRLDQGTLTRAMAMAIAETGAGRDASSFKGDGTLKQNNYYGIHIGKDGVPANQYDPDIETMIEDLKRNFGPGAPYEIINKETLSMYVHGKPWDKLTDAQKKSITNEDHNGELDRYLWAISKFGL